MWNYVLLLISTALFAVMFAFNDRYRAAAGSGVCAALNLSFFSSCLGVVLLWCVGGFALPEFTTFGCLMGAALAVNEILFSLFSIKTLQYVNLSVYSVYAMLGGMLLPAVFGILFAREPMTWQIGLCVVLIFGALLLTVEGKGGKRSKFAPIFYLLVFFFNGMSGVLTKIHQMGDDAVSSNSFVMWGKIGTILIAGSLLLCLPKLKFSLPKRGYLPIAGLAVTSTIANLLLVVTLQHLPASVQYPIVTGGVMVFSTILAFLMRERVTKRQILSMVLAVLATVAVIL